MNFPVIPSLQDRLVYHDRATQWLWGLLCLAGGLTFAAWGVTEPAARIGAAVWFVTAAALILFASNLTITADRTTRTLTLRYGFLLVLHRTRTLSFDDIADIQCQQTRTRASTQSHSARTVWRIIAVRTDGQVVPFRRYFTQDSRKKQQAAELRELITGAAQSRVPPVPVPASVMVM